MRNFEIGGDFEIKKSSKIRERELIEKYLLAKYLNIGYYLISPILLGLAVGLAGDWYFGTKPRLIFVFIIFGAVGTFYNLYKTVKESE